MLLQHTQCSIYLLRPPGAGLAAATVKGFATCWGASCIMRDQQALRHEAHAIRPRHGSKAEQPEPGRALKGPSSPWGLGITDIKLSERRLDSRFLGQGPGSTSPKCPKAFRWASWASEWQWERGT